MTFVAEPEPEPSKISRLRIPAFNYSPPTPLPTPASSCFFLFLSKPADNLVLPLAGTATVAIRVEDVNDSPPRFEQDEYSITVNETYGDRLPEDAVLNITVLDEDERNTFYFSVGAGLFSIRSIRIRLGYFVWKLLC